MRGLTRRGFFPAALAVGLGGALGSLDRVLAADGAVKVRLGTLAPRGSSYANHLLALGEQWRPAPGGGVLLTVYPDGTMGTEADMVRRMRFGQLQAGMLTAMDEAYLKHHFWVRPKLQKLPSEYFRRHGFASFQEDKPGLDLAERYGLVDNLMWGNDYPHHEGTWPHSAEAIERTMGHLSETARANVLGLNAARFFGFEVPAGRGLSGLA